MGPESRGSKKSFCPRRAAAGESRYLLVRSSGSPGSGESVLITTHSWGEKSSLSSEKFCLPCPNCSEAIAPATATKNRANNVNLSMDGPLATILIENLQPKPTTGAIKSGSQVAG